jgi:uncharacterized DUF497 family protein
VDIYFDLGGDSFVWDSAKAQKNLTKHGVSFEEAATVFADPLFILVDASGNEEARDVAIGFGSFGRLLYVVHIEIEDTCIRIISARRTGPEEEKHYAY